MAWTSPLTAVANSALTAAQWNTHVRDNLNMTAPAQATTGGRLIVTSGVNAVAERAITTSEVQTSESTASTSNTNLTTVGPSVTVTTGTSALVAWSCEMSNNTLGGQCLVDYAVSGASARGASDTTALKFESSAANDVARIGTVDHVTGLTAGSNVFTSKYWVSAGTGSFARRRMTVIAL